MKGILHGFQRDLWKESMPNSHDSLRHINVIRYDTLNDMMEEDLGVMGQIEESHNSELPKNPLDLKGGQRMALEGHNVVQANARPNMSEPNTRKQEKNGEVRNEGKKKGISSLGSNATSHNKGNDGRGGRSPMKNDIVVRSR